MGTDFKAFRMSMPIESQGISFLGLTICPTIQFVKNMHYNSWVAPFELFSSAYEFLNV